MKDYPHMPGWRLNKSDNKPAIKHSILMLTTHGVAEGEWNGNEWIQYRWSAKVKDSDVYYWLYLEDLTQLEKEGDSLQQKQPSSNLDEVAEEYANKEHPDEPSVGQWGTGDYEPPIDREYLRKIAKDAFKKGAGWKEKQDELAWKDLQKLDIIANKLWQDGKYDKNDAQEFYTEVLKRFEEYKEQKNK